MSGYVWWRLAADLIPQNRDRKKFCRNLGDTIYAGLQQKGKVKLQVQEASNPNPDPNSDSNPNPNSDPKPSARERVSLGQIRTQLDSVLGAFVQGVPAPARNCVGVCSRIPAHIRAQDSYLPRRTWGHTHTRTFKYLRVPTRVPTHMQCVASKLGL